MSYSPAVIIPADRPASLGIARSLGRRGIPVFGVDPDPLAIGMVSKYVRACPLPNTEDTSENRLQFLLDLGKKLGGKTVLFPVSDDDVLLCSRERIELEKYYRFVMPEDETISNLLTKDGIHLISKKLNIPSPKVFHIKCFADVEAIASELPYPVIFKPVLSTSWLRPEIISLLRSSSLSGSPKVALCPNAEVLLDIYSKIAAYDDRMIIEEVIPGEDDRLAYFCFYMNRQSEPLAIFAGKKLRVLPIGFGSASFVESFYDSELEEVSMKLLSGVQYQGLGGIEFKKDPRDNQYKLIEFNARMGMWDALSIRCGIDIPYIAYCDTLGQPVNPQREYRNGVLWIDFQRDVRAFLLYRKHKLLKFSSWLRSYWGEKDWSVYVQDDWKPALLGIFKMFQLLWKSLKKKLPFVYKSEL